MIFTLKNIDDKNACELYIKNLREGKVYIVEVKLKRERRTIDQNSLYWLWLKCLSEETGYRKDELHEVFKAKFLGHETHKCFDIEVIMPKSTTKLNTKEMFYYLERIRQFADTEIDCRLPLPSDLGWAQFYERYKNYI